MVQGQQEASSAFIEATDYLRRAVDGLRQAGSLHYLPRGLLARSELNRVTAEVDRAQEDVNEAMSIARRCGMGLYQADCHLEYARLYLVRSEREKAQESWATAKEMIKQMGYHRRDKDAAEIETMLKIAFTAADTSDTSKLICRPG